ncbi:MAG: hypothetical protein J5449_05210 [Oscillospiraceae bacterium]|nr:hypothetical protein [Oscillospiraceae bacterium]
MYKVVSQLSAGKCVALELDKKVTEHDYDAIRCDGEIYETVPCYGIDDIGVLSDKNYVGKTVELVLAGKGTVHNERYHYRPQRRVH